MQQAPSPRADAGPPAELEIWDKTIGPLWTIHTVQWLLGGISHNDIHRMVANHELLELRTQDGWVLYPAFQFDPFDVCDGVVQVLQRFRGTNADPWAIAAWFNTPSDALGGKSPSGMHRHTTYRDPDAVYEFADATAARWSTR